MLFNKFPHRYSCILLLVFSCITGFAQPGNAKLLGKGQKADSVKNHQTDSGLLKKAEIKEISILHLKQQQADNERLVNELKIKEQAIEFRNRLFWFRNVLALFAVGLIWLVVRSNRQKTTMNKVLQKQNANIALQKAEISKQKEILHQLNHTKDRLFSVISHDLRSPFASILQAMDSVLAKDLSADEQKEILNSFYQQLSVVNLMVNNLLVWADSQQSGINTDLITLNITKTVDEIIQVSSFLAKKQTDRPPE